MKNRFLRNLFCILLTCALLFTSVFPAFAVTPAERRHLSFNADGKFRILNFSDIQDDDELNETVKFFIRRAVYDARPDLIVLTGDNIFGPSVEGYETTERAIAEFMDIFESLGVPVAIVFGNHDDDDNGVSKEKQMEIYNRYNVSISYDEGSDIAGCGTYNVPIYGSTDTDSVKFNLWMFDTGSTINSAYHHRYDYMRKSQLDWYVAKSNELKENNGGVPVPSIAFQHIIVNDIYDALKPVPRGTDGAVKRNGVYYVLPDTAAPGGFLLEPPCPSTSPYETEFSVVRSQGDVLAIVSGHDHKNQFVVPYQGIDLINTPSAGFYSNLVYHGDSRVRGARIIDIDEQTGTYSTEMLLLGKVYGTDAYIREQKVVGNVALCEESIGLHKTDTREQAFADAYDRMYEAVDAENGNGVVLSEDLDVPLNRLGRSNRAVCMGYTLTDRNGRVIYDLGLLNYKKPGSTGINLILSQLTDERTGNCYNGWRLCNYDRRYSVSGTDGDVDLNSNEIRVVKIVADYDSKGRNPISEIRIVSTGDTPIDMADYPDYQLAYTVFGDEVGPEHADLNENGTGGHVYLLYKVAHDAYIALDSMPLRKVCFEATKRLKFPAETYTEKTRAALAEALQEADVILADLNDDGRTNVYKQPDLDAAANLVKSRISALRLADAIVHVPLHRVTFDPGEGICTVRSRTVTFGSACGTLPDARRSHYVLDGWYTAPKGGERITEDTVYMEMYDKTWYAHWAADPDWIAGDADADSSVDLQDLVLLQRYVAGGWNVQIDFDHADVNADGKLDLRDVVLLRRSLAGGWDVKLI